MSEGQATWGVVTTIKAPARDILNFAAYHVDLGARLVYIHLDEPCPEVVEDLRAHPNVRLTVCFDNYWRKRIGKKRPVKHQIRQAYNATRVYSTPPEVDWLAHIDADEFLWPADPLGEILGALPATVKCARMRPIESIAGNATLFKGFIPSGPERAAIVERIYPNFGGFLKGGFLSHRVGKLFVRTGLGESRFGIHSFKLNGEKNPDQIELEDVLLCHCHTVQWEDWLARYRYRLENGSYREKLAPVRPRHQGGVTLHELFRALEDEEGETGLRRFYDEVCGGNDQLRNALDAEGLLKTCDLGLDRKRQKHFPD